MDTRTLSLAMGEKLSLTQYAAVLDGFNAALVAASCTTAPRAAMYCAQTGHESLGLFYQQELWGPTAQQKRYDPASGSQLAKDLGNTEPGDGALFKGRGRIQLTGRGNYLAFGRWCRSRGLVDRDDHFVRAPALVATSPWCDLAAAWYWTVARPRINGMCDAGDLVGVTKAINGGTNGLEYRRQRYATCLRLGAALLPDGPAPAPAPVSPGAYLARGMTGDAVKRWQDFAGRSYSRFGRLAIDGDFGAATEAFTKRIQGFLGLPADGVVGPGTCRATGFRL